MDVAPKLEPRILNFGDDMFYKYLFVNKETGTYAEACLASGLAYIANELLSHQTAGQHREVLIEDIGDSFRLTLTPELNEQIIEQFGRLVRPYESIEKQLLDELKQGETAFYNAKKLGIPALSPDPLLALYKALNSKEFGALKTYNKLATFWDSARMQPSSLKYIFDYYSHRVHHHNKHDVEEKAWQLVSGSKDEVTRVQMFNPHTGKGINSKKANSVSKVPLKAKTWFSQWLQVIGLREAGIVKRVKVKDRTYDSMISVITPTKISFELLRRLRGVFETKYPRSGMASSQATMAVLGMTETLLEYFHEHVNEIALEEGLWQPAAVVGGFDSAYFKNMGAAVVMNIGFINLPPWIKAQNGDEAMAYIQILRQIGRIVSLLDGQSKKTTRKGELSAEKHTEYLQCIRDLVSSSHIPTFFKFAAYQASLTMAVKGDLRYALSITHIERLAESMKDTFADIVKNDGFKAVAKAIRNATRKAIYGTSNKQRFQSKGLSKYPYDVAYGLDEEIKRSASDKAKLVATISKFIQKYNWENARVAKRMMELNYPRSFPLQRSTVSDEELFQLMMLIDDNEPTAIAMLLLAIGYAKSSGKTGEREPQAIDDHNSDTEDEE